MSQKVGVRLQVVEPFPFISGVLSLAMRRKPAQIAQQFRTWSFCQMQWGAITESGCFSVLVSVAMCGCWLFFDFQGWMGSGQSYGSDLPRLARPSNDKQHQQRFALYVTSAKKNMTLQAAARAWAYGMPWASALKTCRRAIMKANARAKAIPARRPAGRGRWRCKLLQQGEKACV